MLISELRWCFQLLDRKQIRDYGVVVVLSTLSALMEMVGIASVIPAISVLVDYESAITSNHLQWIHVQLGEPDPHSFLVALTVAAIALVWFSSLVTMLAVFANRRLLNGFSADIAARVFRRYVGHPIEEFYGRASSEFLRNVNGVSERVSMGVIGASITLLSRVVQLIVILALLFAVNSFVTTILIVVVFGSYLVVFLGIRKRLARMTSQIFLEARTIQQLIIGSYQAYRNITIDRRLESFVRHFRDLKEAATRRVADIEIIGTAPRQLIEMAGITLLLVASFLVGQSAKSSEQFISVMALFGIAAYRILPSAQQVYQSAHRMSVSLVVCGKVSEEWGDLREAPTPSLRGVALGEKPKVLRVEDISYSYGGRRLFFGMTADIPLSGLVRIAGVSGCGKTTFLELLTGLRNPMEGRVLLDGTPLSGIDRSSWWPRVSYLSQGDYLFEGSLRENIVLDGEELDEQRLRCVAEICDLRNLGRARAGGFDLRISEGGVNLSGGQRARVLLARAIYKSSDVLFLDEAFAALDEEAARVIIDRLRTTFPERCVVVVSHRRAELPAATTTIHLPAARDGIDE